MKVNKIEEVVNIKKKIHLTGLTSINLQVNGTNFNGNVIN